MHSYSFLNSGITSSVFRGAIVITLAISLGFAVVNFSAQMLLTMSAAAVLFIFLIYPAKFLLGYLILLPILDQLIPFFTVQSAEFRIGPQTALRGGLLLLMVLYWLVNQRNPFVFKSALPIFMLIPLLAINTVINGLWVGYGITDLAKMAFWMFLTLVVADMVAQQKIELKTIYQCVIFSLLIYEVSLIISEYLLVTGKVSFDTGTYHFGDFSGVLRGYNISTTLTMGLPVVLAVLTRNRNRFLTLTLLLLSSLIVINIMKTFSRTGYITLIVGLFMLNVMLWHYGEGKGQHRLVLGVAFILIIGVIAIYALTHIDWIAERFSDTTGSGRSYIWAAALKTYAYYPIFMKLLGGGYGKATIYQGVFMGTHNGYLFLLLSGGLIGLCLYLWLLMSFGKQIKPNSQSEYLPFILASTAIAMYLVADAATGIYYVVSSNTYFSFIVGGAMGYYKRTEGQHSRVPV